MAPRAGSGGRARAGLASRAVASKRAAALTPPRSSRLGPFAAAPQQLQLLDALSPGPGLWPPRSARLPTASLSNEAAGRHKRACTSPPGMSQFGHDRDAVGAQPPPAPCSSAAAGELAVGQGQNAGRRREPSLRQQRPRLRARRRRPSGRASQPGDTPGIRDHGIGQRDWAKTGRAAAPVAARPEVAFC